MSYVNKLRELREDRDLSQSQVGKLLNKSQQGYAHLENGNARFTIEDLIKLCEFYGVSSDYVLGLPKDLSYPDR